MIAWFKIGSRNLIKNRRRSVITILAIAFGFAAVNLFGGFQEYMYRGNRESAIYAGCQGHLTIFKKGYLEKGLLDPAAYLLTPTEIRTMEEICQKNPHVLLVTPQLMISGIVSNGHASTIFIAQGIVPSAMEIFLGESKYLKKLGVYFEGRKLEDDKIYGVAMAEDLARLLDLKPGADARLREQPEVDGARTAAIGFCFGGLSVLDIARTGADVAGVVSLHGIFAPPGDTADNRITARVLALHGWEDPLATPDDVVGLARELTSMGADWQIHAYGHTTHAFTNQSADDWEGGKQYSAAADRRSWLATENFLAELFGN